MNDLDARLAGWTPVRAEDMLETAASPDAPRLLRRILNQPAASPPRRHSYRPKWQAGAWITAATAAVTIAGIVATLPGPHSQTSPPTVSAGHRVVGFQPGPSLGVANNA